VRVSELDDPDESIRGADGYPSSAPPCVVVEAGRERRKPLSNLLQRASLAQAHRPPGRGNRRLR
jgi:hypothetical protein